MNAVAILRELETLGIRVVLQGDKVRLRGPTDALKPDFTERLRHYKTEIAEAIRACPVCVECGAAITEPVNTWWGGEPVHYACGEAAWRREWRRKSTPPATPE